MKKVLFLFTLLLLQSCGNAVSENSDETGKSNVDTGVLVFASEGKIPSVDFDGLAPIFEKNNDTTYVINFWATWCKPCVKELPYFEKLNSDYSDEKVKVILVSLDDPRKLETHVAKFVENRDIKSDVILLDDSDTNTWIPKVDESWSGAIPATIIYKSDKRKFHEGSLTFEELQKELISIL